jgi:hypothetical protein
LHGSRERVAPLTRLGYARGVLVTKTVYSLYLPETRAMVDALWAERPHALYERNYEKRQDAMHEPFLAGWRRWIEDGGVRLPADDGHAYPTAGASEGIFAVMAAIATGQLAGGGDGSPAVSPRIHVFEGEYEGHGHVAAAVGMTTVAHARDPERHRSSLATARASDVLFLSAPSAIDGNVWHEAGACLRWAADALPHLRVVVDLTYVGAVDAPVALDLDAPNIAVVLGSASKPFGVYYHRIGALWSRAAIPSLYGNLWFKNLFSLELGRRLMAAFGPTELPRRHRALQRRALRDAVAEGAVPPTTTPSDVLMLANCRTARVDASFATYVRATEGDDRVLRFCLSPAIDRLLAPQDASP